MANINDLGFPFTSVSGDRQYTASEWREYFDALVTSGVVGEYLNQLQVKPQTVANKTVFVDTGAILIRGAMRSISSSVNLTIADNTSGNARIDRIVARLNYTDRKIEFVVKQGTPAGSPVAPSLTRNTAHWELSLAKISVANGFSTIEAAQITDERADDSVCGYYKYRAKLMGQIPVEAWMYTIFKNQLSEQEISNIEADSGLMSIINTSAIKLLSNNWNPDPIQVYNEDGSYNWVAPDINSGQPYEVGVFIMGGGGAGGSAKRTGASGSASTTGGASGYSRHLTLTVTPGLTYPVVVGAGGAGVVVGSGVATASSAGNNGGSSSFNGVVAFGGNGGGGGQGTAASGSSTIAKGGTSSDSGSTSSVSAYAPIYGEIFPVHVSTSAASQPMQAFNAFSGEFFGGAGGSGISLTTGTNVSQPTLTLNDGYSAGAGRASSANSSIVGYSATSIGSGGGGCALSNAASYTTPTVVGGNGKNGIVAIYKRGV